MNDKDYASELAAKWHESVGLTKTCRSAIEGAVREALGKAADSVVCVHSLCDCADNTLEAIRALGAKS